MKAAENIPINLETQNRFFFLKVLSIKIEEKKLNGKINQRRRKPFDVYFSFQRGNNMREINEMGVCKVKTYLFVKWNCSTERESQKAS